MIKISELRRFEQLKTLKMAHIPIEKQHSHEKLGAPCALCLSYLDVDRISPVCDVCNVIFVHLHCEKLLGLDLKSLHKCKSKSPCTSCG